MSGTVVDGDAPDVVRPNVDVRVATADYFEALGIPLRAGRTFGSGDADSGPAVALVSESMERAFWPGESALGERVFIGMVGEWATVVGVVGDIRHGGLDQGPRPTLYRPYTQWDLSYATLMARVTSDPEAALPRIRQFVRAIDPTIVISREQTLEQMIRGTTLPSTSRALLLGSLAAIALLLSGVGVYGVLAYSVQNRTREMGIRLAIGAEPGSLRRLVIGKAAMLCGIAVAIGLVAAAGLNGLLTSLLFEVDPLDPAVLAGCAAFLLATGLGAAYLPAARAGRVDPVTVLRDD